MDNRKLFSKKMEKCIVCKKDTEYAVDTPIKDRQFYMEGAGQLCQKCHYDLYVRKEN